jgi:DNA-binding MarR family transcriptional regulator
MQRIVKHVDVNTGEILDAGVMVWVPHRPRIKEGWLMMFQDGLTKLAKDRSLTQQQLRVLLYLMGKLDFENYIHMPQREIAEAIGMARPHVSTAIRQLVRRGILHNGPVVGRVGTLRLSPTFGWKGRVRSLVEERTRRLVVIQGGKPGSAESANGPRKR